MREDIAACSAHWDKKALKRAYEVKECVEGLPALLGEDRAVVVEPAATYEPETGGYGTWGAVALTPRELVFNGWREQKRLTLAEIDHIDITWPSGFLASRKTGPMIELRSGSETSYFEAQSKGAGQRLWPALQEHVARARETAASAEDAD
jgi:hypothetical protein